MNAVHDHILSNSRKNSASKCRIAFFHSHIIAFANTDISSDNLKKELQKIAECKREDAVHVAQIDDEELSTKREYMLKHFLFRETREASFKRIKSQSCSKNHPSRQTGSESQSTDDSINVDNISVSDSESREDYSINDSQPGEGDKVIYSNSNSSSTVSKSCANSCKQKMPWPSILSDILSKYDALADSLFFSLCRSVDNEYASSQRSELIYTQNENDEMTEFEVENSQEYLQSLLDLHDHREAELLQLWQKWILSNTSNGVVEPFLALMSRSMSRDCHVTFLLSRHFMRYLFPSPRGPGPL